MERNSSYSSIETEVRRATKNLLEVLTQRAELHCIEAEVDPHLEIAAVTDLVCKQPGGGSALLFQHVKNSPLAVATNLFGTPARAQLAWGGEDPSALGRRLGAKLKESSGSSVEQRLERLLAAQCKNPLSYQKLIVPPADVNLTSLPAIQSWPGDGGPYLTMALASLRDSDTGTVNWGIYRIQILGADRAAIHFLPNGVGAKLLHTSQESGKPLPIAVSLGGNPALLMAAGLPLPGAMDEAAFVGLLTGKQPRLAEAPHTGLPIPADAEVVFEGFIHPHEHHLEGPFGNHTGLYKPAAPMPVARISALYHYQDAVCPATVVGPPPMENIQWLKAAEPLVLALLQAQHPEIKRLAYFSEGAFHGCVLLAVEGGRMAKPLVLARSLWQKGPLQRARLLVFVDAEQGGTQGSELFWSVINRVDPGVDILINQGRMAVDATQKNDWPRVRRDPEISAKIVRRWREYGFDG